MPVALELPAEQSFDAVGRLVVAGVGARAGLTIRQTEDLQRALEAIFELGAACDSLTVTMTFAPADLHVSVGPFRTHDEQDDLERVVSAFVDELAVDELGPEVWVRMRISYARRFTASLCPR